jgi:biopolymer transport protein ExbB
MIRAGFALVLLGLATAAPAQEGLDELLRQIRQSSNQAAVINQERETRFLRDRNEQAALVRKAEADKAAAEARISRVRSQFEAAQAEIRTLKQRLQERAGDTGQMYAAIRQAAGDFSTVAADSLVTAQFPERLALLETLSRGAELPDITQLEGFWFALQEQMTETAKVARFQTRIVDASGIPRDAEVIRIGSFTAFSGDEYLTVEGNGRLAALARQPGGRPQRLARNFANSDEARPLAIIDPTRGALLRVEGEKPSLGERIAQGGAVGYVILLIGAVGLVIAAFQLLFLTLVGRKMDAQLQHLRSPTDDNPLGRVLATFRDDHSADNDDPELLELRLSEAVLRETPRLERAQSILRLFAAVAPLLGLLGTVTGMIATFQAITIFGTGDPKLMAGGISQALVTTVLGLVVAIPLLFINSLLATRSRVLTQILDEQSAVMLASRLEARRG